MTSATWPPSHIAATASQLLEMADPASCHSPLHDPEDFTELLKLLAPLFRSGTEVITYNADDENDKDRYILRGGRWLHWGKSKVIFLGKGQVLD